MGRIGGAPSLKRLILEARSGHNTAVLHVGDFAYDLQTKGGLNGDAFMNRIQDMAAWIPYMTCVGNHEIAFNFSHYRYRFSMPQLEWPTTVDRMWYSFDIARAHFISYSSEVYFTNGSIQDQLDWLTNDLKDANKPENRAKRPWIIAFGHRPMYCSNIDKDDCTTLKSLVRHSLEPLFFQYGVDVIIEAHEHSYERLWPVFNDTVTAHNYINPKAPVHFISGAAGCNESYGICVNPMLGPRAVCAKLVRAQFSEVAESDNLYSPWWEIKASQSDFENQAFRERLRKTRSRKRFWDRFGGRVEIQNGGDYSIELKKDKSSTKFTIKTRRISNRGTQLWEMDADNNAPRTMRGNEARVLTGITPLFILSIFNS
ncbi:hypothetical protein OS493_030304 [Desmophyllum pertusum]|uniref:Calcineurin-like phosphoesterase domain-containing protein n=1 Tax=Desmophyllum pertusum TaxID=174260 RepID=A0A9W9ZK43_9CNID|nr:hypothetical protein OS493_030304 [Desmophyllum pertusum]